MNTRTRAYVMLGGTGFGVAVSGLHLVAGLGWSMLIGGACLTLAAGVGWLAQVGSEGP